MKKFISQFIIVFILVNLLSALEITNIKVHSSQGSLLVSFYLEKEFPQELMDLIHSGVETTLIFKIKVMKNRKLWFDRKMASKELIVKIVFFPVTKQYKTTKTLSGVLISSLETDSEEEMKEWLRKFDDLNITSLENFTMGSKYIICIEGNIFPKYLMKLIPRSYKISARKEFKL